MLCFFVNLEALSGGEDERLRFVLVVVVVMVACWPAEVEGLEEEVDERLVLVVEGFVTELAWRVTLESLETWVGLEVTTSVILLNVGFGGLEKSTSEDSLSDEVDSEEDDEDDASAFEVTVLVSVDLGASSSGSLSNDELSEEDASPALATAVVAAAGLEDSGADSLSDEEVSEEEEEEEEE